jgi:undecaprenyl-diphosphatase
MSRPADARALPLRHAVALGLLHGPAELLPVSSSAHMTLVPWLLGWPYAELDGDVRKAFEVAVHGGTAAALVVALPRGRCRVSAGLVALATLPPALAGLIGERPIEERLGTPGTITAGLAAGAAAMLAADRAPQVRRTGDARAMDALWLGVAQAAALVPGVSRNGATLAAARARGFARADASALSWRVAVPVLVGAGALKAVRLRSTPPPARRAMAAGAAAAFASTLAVARRAPRDGSLAPYALYRLALAAVVTARRARMSA